MTFNEYQEQSRKTARYDVNQGIVYPVLGLNGEAGEVAEKLKKIIRDHGGVISAEAKIELVKELGDVLWYLSQIAYDLKVSLDDVAKANLEKLFSRLERNQISGNGDNR